MSIEAFVSKFNATLDEAVHQAMETDVTDSAKAMIAGAVQTEVYNAYEPVMYQRRGELGEDGGLNDFDVMEAQYDRTTMTLEVQDMSRDEETGRLIAPVVESGKGYQYKWPGQKPRPFHKKAQEDLAASGLVNEALKKSLKAFGFSVDK